MKFKKIYLTHWVIFLILVIITYSYKYVIIGHSNIYDFNFWLHPDILNTGNTFGEFTFAGIILPDSVLYNSLFKQQSLASSFLLMKLYSPRVVGISFIALLVKPLLGYVNFNLALLFISGHFLIKITELIGEPSIKPTLFFYILPYTIFYSQSITKEILTAAISIMFIYYLLKKNKRGIILNCLLILIVKDFLIVPFVISILFFFSKKNQFTKMHWGIFIFFLIYPFIAMKFNFIGLLKDFSRLYGESLSGTTYYSELILLYLPLSGYIIFPFKVLKNIFEPFPDVHSLIFDNNYLLVYGGVIMISTIYMFRITIKFFFVFIFSLYKKIIFQKEGKGIIIFFCFISFIIVSINGFVHMRYFYFVLPFLPMLVNKGNYNLEVYPKSLINIFSYIDKLYVIGMVVLSCWFFIFAL